MTNSPLLQCSHLTCPVTHPHTPPSPPHPQCLITRGLIPLLAEGSARATDTDTTDEILAAAIEHAKRARYCAKGDSIVALHRIGNASVIKIVDIK